MSIDAIADHNLLTDLTVGQLIAMVGTLAVIIGLIRKVGPILHRLNDLLDDWFGEKERPGVPERPGVMPRLAENHEMLIQQGEAIAEQDKVLAQHTDTLSHLRRKVEPLVDETVEGNHQEVLRKLNEISAATKINGDSLKDVEQLLHRHIRESKHWVRAVDKAAAERDFKLPPWPDLPE